MKNINPVQIIIAMAIFVAGVTTGYFYQKSKTPNFRQMGQQMVQKANQQGQRKFQNRPNMGEVTSLDDKSATIKTIDGSSRIIILSDSTTYTQTAPTDKTGLKVGAQISVIGTDNTDGSVTAQTIQFK